MKKASEQKRTRGVKFKGRHFFSCAEMAGDNVSTSSDFWTFSSQFYSITVEQRVIRMLPLRPEVNQRLLIRST